MSLLGALNSAISGLTAQSTAFSNISENVANAQTVGYKQVDTSFVDYLTTSSNAVIRCDPKGRSAEFSHVEGLLKKYQRN